MALDSLLLPAGFVRIAVLGKDGRSSLEHSGCLWS